MKVVVGLVNACKVERPGFSPVLPAYTMGNTWFVDCKNLCRVPNFGHSAKTCFAERRTRQNIALDKGRHSAKIGRGLNGIQRRPLCRVPPVWHSAKNLLCQVPTLGTRQNNFFFVFFHQFFLSFSTLPQTTCLNLGYFHCLLAYFYSLFCFVEFFQKM